MRQTAGTLPRRLASYGHVAEHSDRGDRGLGAGRMLGEWWERQPARGKRGWVGEWSAAVRPCSQDPRPVRADPHTCSRGHHLPTDGDLPTTGDADIRIGPDSGDSQSASTRRRVLGGFAGGNLDHDCRRAVRRVAAFLFIARRRGRAPSAARRQSCRCSPGRPSTSTVSDPQSNCTSTADSSPSTQPSWPGATTTAAGAW